MKRIISVCLVGVLLVALFSGCSISKDEDDLYAGEYTCVDEIDGKMKISKRGDSYKIIIDLFDLCEIKAEGELCNGTLHYSGEDDYGNEIYGNIEEYGDDYPVRVEFHGDDLFDELEFERK